LPIERPEGLKEAIEILQFLDSVLNGTGHEAPKKEAPPPSVMPLTIKDVARIKGVSHRVVYRAIEKGKLPTINKVGPYFITQSACDAWDSTSKRILPETFNCGHFRSPENTYTVGSNHWCRICRRAYMADYHQRRKMKKYKQKYDNYEAR